jgi:hypothetical protein
VTRERHRNESSRLRGISRREFIKLAATAGLLAGCRPAQQLTATPAHPPTATATSLPAHTATPTTAPTVEPTATATIAPTVTPTSAPPAKLGRVIRARHTGVWDGEKLAPEAIRQMLDASITELTGLNDAIEAWASLFDPGERIAIKVNTIRGSSFWTHVPLVMAVTERLQETGVPAEQIVIFDRDTGELEAAGFPINRDGAGVRCYGTDTGDNYVAGWTVMESNIGFSNILLDCDALINMPILKQHGYSGISFAMKNHYGTFERPWELHHRIEHALPELNALQPIKERTRLIIGDVLTVVKQDWSSAITGDSIVMSFDPVAHDTIGLQLCEEALASEGLDSRVARSVTPWLELGAELGLGINDPDSIDLVDITLG